MNNISTLISVLTIEERKKFILELKKKNKRNDVKNIELFLLLANNANEKNLDVLLYGKSSKGAYHALCKRLYDALIDFISIKSFEEEVSEEVNIYKLIRVSKILFEKHHEKLAFKILTKAELKSKNQGMYALLSEVYTMQIQFSHLYPELSLDVLIQKFQANKKILDVEERMNLFYASVQEELKHTHLHITDVIERNLVRFGIALSDGLTYQALYRILEICNKVANVSRNYHEILSFVETTYDKVHESDTIKNRHLIYHIQILYYMANTYFRVKDFAKSRLYLDKVQIGMKKISGKYNSRITLQYDLLNNLLLMFTGEVELSVSNFETYDFTKNKKEIEYYHDLKLTQVVALFLNGEVQDAYRIINEFYHSDTWYNEKSGVIWVVKKNLIEILLLMELDHFELVESRIKSFRKKYRNHLIAHEESQILEFLKLVSALYNNSKIIENKQFINKVKTLIVKPTELEDVFKISFYAWLKAKTSQQNTYTVCMDLINNKL